MQIKLPSWRRVNPLFFIFALLVVVDVAVYRIWRNPETIGITAVAVLFLGISAIFGVKKVLYLMGSNGAGKKYVAEVVVIHWRGETNRFRGVYRYEWVANFAAQYLAYVLDHFGDVHWEFGIQFRVHDKEKRKDTENSSGSGVEVSLSA